MFFVLSRAQDKEKILSSHEESNLRPPDSTLRCSTTEPRRLYGEQGPLGSSCTIRVLRTARISNVDSVVFVNRIKKMVSSKLSKEIEKDDRACILRPSCDRVLKRIEYLPCAHKHHMVSEIVVVYSFQIQEQFSHCRFVIFKSVYVNYQLLCV